MLAIDAGPSSDSLFKSSGTEPRGINDTGGANGDQSFLARLATTLTAASRESEHLALVVVDLDNFLMRNEGYFFARRLEFDGVAEWSEHYRFGWSVSVPRAEEIRDVGTASGAPQ